MDATESPRPRVAISACLLGDPVRHDGSHRRERWLTDVVGRHVEWVPVCPELEAGFGVPRPAVRLARDPSGSTRMVESVSGADVTDRMVTYAARRSTELGAEGIDGFVVKKGSPSCGVHRVRVATHNGSTHDGTGLFADAITSALPDLAMEEEGRLRDARLRELFFSRIYGSLRVRTLVDGNPSARDLVEFHARNKYVLLSHDPQTARELGQLVARAGVADPKDSASRYREKYLAALAVPSTVGRNVNVLQHLTGAISGITAAERSNLLGTIEAYQNGIVPLVVPVQVVRHLLLEHDASRRWASEQVYLDPYPAELRLRNAV